MLHSNAITLITIIIFEYYNQQLLSPLNCRYVSICRWLFCPHTSRLPHQRSPGSSVFTVVVIASGTQNIIVQHYNKITKGKAKTKNNPTVELTNRTLNYMPSRGIKSGVFHGKAVEEKRSLLSGLRIKLCCSCYLCSARHYWSRQTTSAIVCN